MSRKCDKIIAHWTVTKQPIPLEDVVAILEEYFEGYWRHSKGTSHQIQIEHPILNTHPLVSRYFGVFTIPTRGRKVHSDYCKRLIKVIEAIKENTNEKS